ncbi:MAG TPA: FecR domain-containing protein [Ohtaekwangia sp.]
MEQPKYDMDTLIVRKLSGQISVEEDAWLTRHLETDDTVRSDFDAAKEIWVTSGQLQVKGNLSREQRFNKLQNRIQEEENQRPSRIWLRYAAALILFVLAGAGYWILKPDALLQVQGIAGQTQVVNLPDGSTVIVRGNSSVSYYPDSFLENREITLEGEAYFDVKRNNATFTVTAGQANVIVLGTSFNIHTNGKQTEVGCLTGKVRVNSKNQQDQAIILTPGLGVRVDETLSNVYSITKSNVAGWTTGELTFTANKLTEVFATLEKHFGKEIRFSGPIPDVAFTGKFFRPELDDVLETVCLSVGLTYQIGADSVIAIRKK